MQPSFEEKEWAQAGKALLALTGLACVSLAIQQHGQVFHLGLRIWVGGFGFFSLAVAIRDLWIANRARTGQEEGPRK